MRGFFAITLFCAFVVYGSATPFTDCGSQTGKVSSVEVSNCPDGQDVCILKKGTQPAITIKFSSEADSKELKAVVHGVVMDVPIPFPIPQSNACKSGVSCPVKKGENHTYSNKFSVRNSYPAVSVRVRYELKGDSNSDMVCVEIPCKIE